MTQRECQKTIAHTFTLSGIGVHSGAPSQICFKPASENSGIRFFDKNDSSKVIHIGHIVPINSMHATVLKIPNWQISTIEHGMAALSWIGIDNVDIVIDSEEFPIFDGSSFPFVQSLLEVGIIEQKGLKKYITPRKELSFQDKYGRSIVIKPAKIDRFTKQTELHLVYSTEFEHPLIRADKIEYTITRDLFVSEIAPARTFGFLAQLPFLRKHGLGQGSSLGNTVVFDDNELLNQPRYKNEWTRHKALDLLGDLALLGKQLAGTIIAHKTGHNFNRIVIQHYLDNPTCWNIF